MQQGKRKASRNNSNNFRPERCFCMEAVNRISKALYSSVNWNNTRQLPRDSWQDVYHKQWHAFQRSLVYIQAHNGSNNIEENTYHFW